MGGEGRLENVGRREEGGRLNRAEQVSAVRYKWTRAEVAEG